MHGRDAHDGFVLRCQRQRVDRPIEPVAMSGIELTVLGERLEGARAGTRLRR